MKIPDIKETDCTGIKIYESSLFYVTEWSNTWFCIKINCYDCSDIKFWHLPIDAKNFRKKINDDVLFSLIHFNRQNFQLLIDNVYKKGFLEGEESFKNKFKTLLDI